jgi:adenosine deaminase
MDPDELRSYVHRIPKVELHAHLNGCVRDFTLFELARERNLVLSEHHFSEDDFKDDTISHMYNSKPRSLVDCFDIFVQVTQVVGDLEALKRITREALEDFASHHVAYLELRSTPKRLKRTWDGDEVTSKRDYIETILSVFQEFEQSEQDRYEQEKSQDHATNHCRLPLRARLLVSIDRSKTAIEAQENVDLAIHFHERGNMYVVGMDLGGNPLKNDFRDFEAILGQARRAGLKLTLHCGEIPCAESENNSNPALVKALEEARALLAFHPDRLGHALLLPESLRADLLQAQIPVESCPTSNVMTLELANSFHGHLVEGLRSHPQIEFWLHNDYPFSISTDDSGVFNTDPSKELLLLCIAWKLDEGQVRQIIMQSTDHSFCGEDMKITLRESMASYF